MQKRGQISWKPLSLLYSGIGAGFYLHSIRSRLKTYDSGRQAFRAQARSMDQGFADGDVGC